MEVAVNLVKAFTRNVTDGNPAGVVLNPPDLSIDQMKMISQRLQVSETAFVNPGNSADYMVRFFSPITEVNLCGHATISAFTVIGEKLISKNHDDIIIKQDTKAGILPVQLFFKDNSMDYVLMKQNEPIIEPVDYKIKTLSSMLNTPVDCFSTRFLKARVSTGLFTLPICVHSLKDLEKMTPDFEKMKTFCKNQGVGSLHVFSFETYDKDSLYHARNFAPLYGINEDPVTGTANGAVCSYLRHNNYLSSEEMICEQGDIIKKKGRVKVRINNRGVWVGGSAIIKERKTLDV